MHTHYIDILALFHLFLNIKLILTIHFPCAFIFVGNRRKGIAASKFRYDDEIYGNETGTRPEDLQFSEPNCTSKALNYIVELSPFFHLKSTILYRSIRCT